MVPAAWTVQAQPRAGAVGGRWLTGASSLLGRAAGGGRRAARAVLLSLLSQRIAYLQKENSLRCLPPFAKKKGGQIRMVLDGRPTNASHRLPPHVALGTAAAWSEIDLSELPASLLLWKCSGDLQDSFYQFSAEVLAEDFAFDYPIRAGDADGDHVWEGGRVVPIDADEWIYDCFACISMGWSWAMWIVQCIVCGALDGCRSSSDLPLVADRQPAPRPCFGRVLCGGYVDNFLILAASYREAMERFTSVCEAFAKLAIALHELREPTFDSDFGYLGLVFTFDHKLRPLRS